MAEDRLYSFGGNIPKTTRGMESTTAISPGSAKGHWEDHSLLPTKRLTGWPFGLSQPGNSYVLKECGGRPQSGHAVMPLSMIQIFSWCREQRRKALLCGRVMTLAPGIKMAVCSTVCRKRTTWVLVCTYLRRRLWVLQLSAAFVSMSAPVFVHKVDIQSGGCEWHSASQLSEMTEAFWGRHFLFLKQQIAPYRACKLFRPRSRKRLGHSNAS